MEEVRHCLDFLSHYCVVNFNKSNRLTICTTIGRLSLSSWRDYNFYQIDAVAKIKLFKTYMAVQILVIQPDLNLGIVKTLDLLQPHGYLK